MTKEQAEKIEIEHNVTVDKKSEMYTLGDVGDDYGWVAVPVEWIA